MCCTTHPASSNTTATIMEKPFPYPQMPLVVQEEVIRRLGACELINFSRTCAVNYMRSRRVRAYPIKAMLLDLALQEAETPTMNLQFSGYDMDEMKTLNALEADFGKKRISVMESFVLKGLNPNSAAFTPEQIAQIETAVNKLLPLLAETHTIKIYGLVPTTVAKSILFAAQSVKNIDIAEMQLSETVGLDAFFPQFDDVQDFNISNNHGIQFTSNVFPILKKNSKALRNVTVHEYFDADSIVTFLKAANFDRAGVVDFKIEKRGVWNNFANLRRKITAAKMNKTLPKIGINGTFLRLN
uniref:F-box domain-containing protein n=1 Tax=Panagrellus redivivus TaxID=6233 RepID=A0A7E4V697_PANRE